MPNRLQSSARPLWITMILGALCALMGCEVEGDGPLGPTPIPDDQRARRAGGGPTDGRKPVNPRPGGACQPHTHPLSLAVGSIQIVRDGESGEGLTEVVIEHVGDHPLTLEALELAADQHFALEWLAGDITDPDADGAPGWAPGGLARVQVRHLMRDPGQATGRLLVRASDQCRWRLERPIYSRATGRCVQWTPTALEFPSARVNRVDERHALLVNCSAELMVIEDLHLTGQDADFFSAEVQGFGARPGRAGAVILAPGWGMEIKVLFQPLASTAYQAMVELMGPDDTVAARLPLVGIGRRNQCPISVVTEEALRVQVGQTAELSGARSLDQDGPDSRPVAYEWIVVDRPDESEAQSMENGGEDDPSTPTATFTPDVNGTYVLRLVTTDDQGLDSESCGTSDDLVIRVEPQRDLLVEAIWDLEAGVRPEQVVSADVDLHLLHPLAADWFDPRFDCHYLNNQPDWGAEGDPADDPTLSFDLGGRGQSESIWLDGVEPTDELGAPYQIGVHYYDDTHPMTSEFLGAAQVYLNVYVRGELVWHHDGLPMRLDEAGLMWHAAALRWPSGAVEPVGRVFERRP